MKKTIKFAAALLIGTSLLSTGCLEETFPQQGTVTVDQAGDAPNASTTSSRPAPRPSRASSSTPETPI